MTYQNNQFNYNFITQKKKKQIELFISRDVDGDFMFEMKYDGKVQQALKEHGYEIIQNGNFES